MKKWLALAFALVIALALVLWRSQHPPRLPVPVRDPVEVARAAELENEAAQAEEDDERAELATRITVHVFEKETRAPLAHWSAYLERVPRERDAQLFQTRESHGNEHEQLLTDKAGTADFDVPPGIAYRLATWDSEGYEIDNLVDISALAPNERRSIDVPVSTLPDVHFCVRALDEDTLAPIAGCEVRALSGRLPPAVPGETRRAGREPVHLAQAITAGDGVCEFDLVSRERPHFEFVAPGYSNAHVPATGRHDTRARAFDVRLARSARVRGRVLGAPEATVNVVFSARVNQLRPPSDAGAGYSMQTNPLRSWSAALDADGRFDVSELPVRTWVAAELSVDGATQPVFREQVWLTPGETREVVWDLRPAGRIRGRVVDVDGAPIAGVDVWCVRAQREGKESWVYDATDPVRVVAKVRADERGAFVFDVVRADTWLVGTPRAARDEARGTYLGRAERCVVTPDAPEHDVVLHVTRALEIRGVLVDADGGPWRGGSVRAESVVERFDARAQTDESGCFAVGPLSPGRYRVTCGSPFLGVGEPIEADAGASDVVVRAAPGGKLELRVLADGAPVRRRFTVWIFGAAREREPRIARFQTGTDMRGVASLENLVAGTYTAYVSDAGSRFGVAADLVVHVGDVTRVEVDTVAGAWLRVLTDRTGEPRSVEVEWNGCPVTYAGTGESCDRLERVPAGHLRAVVSRWNGKERETLATHELDLAPDETRVLDLRGRH